MLVCERGKSLRSHERCFVVSWLSSQLLGAILLLLSVLCCAHGATVDYDTILPSKVLNEEGTRLTIK